MTFDVTTNTTTPSSVRNQGKLQQPATYVCISTYMRKQYFYSTETQTDASPMNT